MGELAWGVVSIRYHFCQCAVCGVFVLRFWTMSVTFCRICCFSSLVWGFLFRLVVLCLASQTCSVMALLQLSTMSGVRVLMSPFRGMIVLRRSWKWAGNPSISPSQGVQSIDTWLWIEFVSWFITLWSVARNLLSLWSEKIWSQFLNMTRFAPSMWMGYRRSLAM